MITIIGIDCATKPSKVGLALGCHHEGITRIETVIGGSKKLDTVKVICEWAEGRFPVLLALDAPLGWPDNMAKTLIAHRAGQPINSCPDKMFHRMTDSIVKDIIGKKPLEVGADLIARTAHSALSLIEDLGRIFSPSIPLAWKDTLDSDISAIEVYPGGTLSSYDFLRKGYKNNATIRMEIIDDIGTIIGLPGDNTIMSRMTDSADALDAVVCVLAAHDFLRGNAITPPDMKKAMKEGWIWVRRPVNTQDI